jgi:DNA-binding XRE family transcriptional regulator
VLVFSSARAVASFEVWLFRKLTPERRRLVLAFATASLPDWEAFSGGGMAKRARRHAPGLFELRVTCREAARRQLARAEGPRLSINIFFLLDPAAMILLSGAALTASSAGNWPGTPGLGAARLQLRGLRRAAREGVLCQRLVLDIFEEIKSTGGCTLHPPPRVPLLTPKASGLLALSGLREAVVREAEVEGPQAVAQLEEYEDRFATAAQVVRARRAAGLNQRQLAAMAGVAQYEISLLENGSANPTLTTLARLSRAQGTELRIGAGGAGC